MTSKEVVKELYKERAYAYKDKVCNKGDGWKEAIDHYDNIGKCLIQIEKDLEILEILKRIVKIVDYNNRPTTSLDDQLVILSGGEIKNVEDYDKIKEWLENETNDNTV